MSGITVLVGPEGEWVGQIQGAAAVRIADYFTGECLAEQPINGSGHGAFVTAEKAARKKVRDQRDQQAIDARFGGDRQAWRAAMERAHQRMKRR